MSSVIISGDTSGAITVSAPAVAGTNTLTLQAATATNAVNKLETAVASTSGVSIDYTSIPSWVKKITVMFSLVSTNSTSLIQVQIGSGSVTTTGYSGFYGILTASAVSGASSTTGFLINSNSAANNISGAIQIFNLSGNTWVASVGVGSPAAGGLCVGGGTLALGGVLDRVRITTVNGTDVFDAGSVNLLLEG